MDALKDLPTDLLKIIQNYKDQLDHTSKMAGVIEEISEIKYMIIESDEPISYLVSEELGNITYSHAVIYDEYGHFCIQNDMTEVTTTMVTSSNNKVIIDYEIEDE